MANQTGKPVQKKQNSSAGVFIQIIISLVLFAVLLTVVIIRTQPSKALDASGHREYAAKMYSRGLYEQAAHEYELYAQQADLDKQGKAKIFKLIGDIYYDQLSDYANALANYIKVEALDPEGSEKRDVTRRIVASMDNLGLAKEAKRYMKEATNIDPETLPVSEKGAVVARIGDRKITLGELDREVEKQQSWLKKQIEDDPKEKLRFLRDYIVHELLYDKAAIKNLDKDPEVLEAARQAKRELMIQKLLAREVNDKVQVDEDDIKLYYEAHKSDFNKPEMVMARHIQCSKREDIEEVKKRLNNGEGFDGLVKEFSEDAVSKSVGGSLGYVTKGEPIPGLGEPKELINTIFSTPTGKYSDIVQSEHGFHIVLVEEHKPAENKTLDDVRNMVRHSLTQERQQRAYEKLAGEMLDTNQVQFFDEVLGVDLREVLQEEQKAK
jgi:parvulin-like peptidyl-prolyl isomerase